MSTLFTSLKSKVAALTTFGMGSIYQVTSAGAISTSKYASGTKAIITDTATVVAILLPLSAGLFIAYQSLRKKWADGDGGATSDANKKIKAALITTVIGTTSSTLVSLITGYFT